LVEHPLIAISGIIVLGIAAQWLAWRLRLPSILLLLVFGFAAGPATGLLDPDALLGNLLLPIISVGVSVILFEGGLSLRITELREIGGVVRNLITVGTLATWLISAGAAHFILGLDFALSVLLGAIVVVTGPTVIVPLLRHVRPVGQVGSILKWEGILIDPIGAILAVLVFEAILPGGFQGTATLAAIGFFKTVFIGGVVGVIGAGVMFLLLKHRWIPDFLQNAVSLAVVVSVFTTSNWFQAEAGLLAVTVMGVALANQKTVTVKHIVEFKENLRVLLIASLFVLLAARLKLSDFAHLGLSSLAFLGVLIFVARPVAVVLSTLKSGLSWRERFFLSWMAPRGIVAAAVASVFALSLAEAGYPQAERLVPLTFMVIIGTVAIYGLTASPLARWLQLSDPHPQGVLIAGAHPWARAIAKALQAQDYQVLIIDTNRVDISAARMDGLPTYYGSVFSEYILDEIELGGIGRLLALTSNDEVNSLAALHFADVFSREEVYQLSPEDEAVSSHLRGRLLFRAGITYTELDHRFAGGEEIKITKLTPEFDYKAFQARYGETAIPLFLINENGSLGVLTRDNQPEPRPGQLLISLIGPVEGTLNSLLT
jgi:NhaP-type Na+/H+ or K+/H+ antiporter